jgi:hypothetical protein
LNPGRRGGEPATNRLSYGAPFANLHSTNFSTIIITYHLGLVQQASGGRSTKRLSLTPLRIRKKNIDPND